MPKEEFDPEDPNELVGVALGGSDADEENMAFCVVDEYVRMGFGREDILKMFRDPFFRMTHGVYRRRGEGFVTALVDRVLGQWKECCKCPA